jgi:hypothetical protein
MKKILAADLEAMLPADKGESRSQFDEELLDVLEQPFLESSLLGVFGEGQELEFVGVS